MTTGTTNGDQVRGGALKVEFGAARSAIERTADGGCLVRLPIPVLGGESAEWILEPTDRDAAAPPPIDRSGLFELVGDRAGIMAGAAMLPAGPGEMEHAAREIYRALLRVVGGDVGLYRIWNYVPRINAQDDGLERYRAFNLGRWTAFSEDRDQPDGALLPAASAVGVEEGGDMLTVVFVAGRLPVRFHENPGQVPAWEYPSCHGPRPPSFCRGAVVRRSSGELHRGYLSGTASIRGHETIGEGDVNTQVRVTCDNVRVMEAEMGVSRCASSLKCYVRHAGDLDAVRRALGRESGEEAASRIQFLEAAICRGELLLEVEAVYR